MKAFRIFWKRVTENFHFQRKSLGLALDWTVIVYVVIPALVILSHMYVSVSIQTITTMDGRASY